MLPDRWGGLQAQGAVEGSGLPEAARQTRVLQEPRPGSVRSCGGRI